MKPQFLSSSFCLRKITCLLSILTTANLYSSEIVIESSEPSVELCGIVAQNARDPFRSDFFIYGHRPQTQDQNAVYKLSITDEFDAIELQAILPLRSQRRTDYACACVKGQVVNAKSSSMPILKVSSHDLFLSVIESRSLSEARCVSIGQSISNMQNAINN